jgi:oligopeptide transport system substrate-binding protein
MKKKTCIALLLIFASLLNACGSGVSSSSDPASTYRILYGSEMTTLNYLVTGSAVEYKVLVKAIDGLVDYDQYGVLTPAIASSWEPNSDYTQWTFHLRSDVKWVDHTGKEVATLTANDFVESAKYYNEARNESANQYLYEFVKNAATYYDQSSKILAAENAVSESKFDSLEAYYQANNIEPSSFITFEDVGVKALDDETLVYTMERPCPFFLSVTCFTAYLPVYGPFLDSHKDAFGLDNTNLLYNGAYIISEFEPNVRRTLIQNPLYYDADKISISRIEYTYNADEVTLSPNLFKTGETDYAIIGSDILDAWLNAEDTKDLIHPTQPELSYSYFFNFNFEPRFDSAYEPDNWLKAVNNENFRKSLFYGLDRLRALTVKDPYNGKYLVNNSITPKTFAVTNGKDYTSFGLLAQISERDSFNEESARQYKISAMNELASAGATFPIKILMPFNPQTTNWDKETIVIEQQLEALLGKDYIDIIVTAGPSTNFLSEIRRSGKYALMKCNWGADYADPQTWTDPFTNSSSYGFFYTDPNKILSEKPATSKTAETESLVSEYYSLLDIAKAQTSDGNARFEAFAKAEAHLIDHAFVIPFSVDNDGYVADRIDPFSLQYSPFGVSKYRYKGTKLMDVPMGSDAYNTAYETWHSLYLEKQADQ